MTDAIEATAEDLDAPASTMTLEQLVTPRPAALAVTPSVEAGELVARLSVIREAMQTAMQDGVDYGRIPGVTKPTLLKPGAEKLGVLFQLDIQFENTKTWGPGDHLTVECSATVFHAPTGTRLGKGEGLCTTREKKYAKRKQERTCPQCGVAAIIKGKQEYGGGWVCFKKKDGCGAKFPDGAAVIEDQAVGEIDNPDLPDQWNPVVKMAQKRARVDAVLAVTGASALFTQDAEDMAPPPPPPPAEDAEIANVKRLIRKHKVKTAEIRRMLRDYGVLVPEGKSVVAFVEALGPDSARDLATRIENGAIPTGESDVPAAGADEFVHPSVAPDDVLGPS